MVAADRVTAFFAQWSEVRRVSLDRAWVGPLGRAGFTLRSADVGAVIRVESVARSRRRRAR